MLQQNSYLVLTLDIDKSTLVSVVTFILGLPQYNESTLLLSLESFVGDIQMERYYFNEIQCEAWVIDLPY